jgi:hypothetical protein
MSKTLPKLSRPAQKRVSQKIRKLIHEGYEQAQAAAIAYKMERAHLLGSRGGKKQKNPTHAGAGQPGAGQPGAPVLYSDSKYAVVKYGAKEFDIWNSKLNTIIVSAAPDFDVALDWIKNKWGGKFPSTARLAKNPTNGCVFEEGDYRVYENEKGFYDIFKGDKLIFFDVPSLQGAINWVRKNSEPTLRDKWGGKS